MVGTVQRGRHISPFTALPPCYSRGNIHRPCTLLRKSEVMTLDCTWFCNLRPGSRDQIQVEHVLATHITELIFQQIFPNTIFLEVNQSPPSPSRAHQLQLFLQLSNTVIPLFLSPSSPLLKFTSSLFFDSAISHSSLLFFFCLYVTIFTIPSLLTTSLFHSHSPLPLTFPHHKVCTFYPAAHLTVVSNGGGGLQ